MVCLRNLVKGQSCLVIGIYSFVWPQGQINEAIPRLIVELQIWFILSLKVGRGPEA